MESLLLLLETNDSHKQSAEMVRERVTSFQVKGEEEMIDCINYLTHFYHKLFALYSVTASRVSTRKKDKLYYM